MCSVKPSRLSEPGPAHRRISDRCALHHQICPRGLENLNHGRCGRRLVDSLACATLSVGQATGARTAIVKARKLIHMQPYNQEQYLMPLPGNNLPQALAKGSQGTSLVRNAIYIHTNNKQYHATSFRSRIFYNHGYKERQKLLHSLV